MTEIGTIFIDPAMRPEQVPWDGEIKRKKVRVRKRLKNRRIEDFKKTLYRVSERLKAATNQPQIMRLLERQHELRMIVYGGNLALPQ